MKLSFYSLFGDKFEFTQQQLQEMFLDFMERQGKRYIRMLKGKAMYAFLKTPVNNGGLDVITSRENYEKVYHILAPLASKFCRDYFEEIALKDINSFKEALLLTKDNEPNFFPDDFPYLWAEIEFDKNENEYCWSLEINYNVLGSTGYVYPMKDSNCVKTFKTRKGCINNLVKHMEYWLNKYNQPKSV